MNECFLCGQFGFMNTHHIFGAYNRPKSEKYGLTVTLCRNCHTEGRDSAHRSAETAQRLHEYGQQKWMSEQGKTRQDFIREFGKNYI